VRPTHLFQKNIARKKFLPTKNGAWDAPTLATFTTEGEHAGSPLQKNQSVVLLIKLCFGIKPQEIFSFEMPISTSKRSPTHLFQKTIARKKCFTHQKRCVGRTLRLLKYATLDTSGWLALTRPGLTPRKKCQASLGAPTLHSLIRLNR